MSARAVARMLLVGCLLLPACGGESPEQAAAEAARAFWAALRAGDTAAAAEVALPIAPERLEDLAARPLEAVALHEVLVGPSHAAVETTLPTDDPADPLRFLTHVAETDAGWRVDAGRTAGELRSAAVARGMQAAEESIREATRAIGDAIAEGARGAAQALEQAVEAWERELDAMPREGAPREPGTAPDPEAAPETGKKERRL